MLLKTRVAGLSTQINFYLSRKLRELSSASVFRIKYEAKSFAEEGLMQI